MSLCRHGAEPAGADESRLGSGGEQDDRILQGAYRRCRRHSHRRLSDSHEGCSVANCRRAIPGSDLMSHLSRSQSRPKPAVFAVALLAAAASLVACSGEPQSLADYIATICATPFRSASPDEAPFLAENVSAMTKMMTDMGIRPSGDVDNEFVSMMTPHHQGAIDMAQAELRYGHNEQVRRMAQEIIVTQQQE